MLQFFDFFRLRNYDKKIIFDYELFSFVWCKTRFFDIEFYIWQSKQIFFLVFNIHFSARQKLKTIKIIHKNYIKKKNLKKHVTDLFNNEFKSFTIFKKFLFNENLNQLNIESWFLSNVFRIEYFQMTKKMRFDINNIKFTHIKVYSNFHHLSVLSFSNFFSFNVFLQLSNILLNFFIVFYQLYLKIQKQKIAMLNFNSRILITQSFTNEKTVEKIIEILLTEYFFFKKVLHLRKRFELYKTKLCFRYEVLYFSSLIIKVKTNF